jgi:hypothetical protein
MAFTHVLTNVVLCHDLIDFLTAFIAQKFKALQHKFRYLSAVKNMRIFFFLPVVTPFFVDYNGHFILKMTCVVRDGRVRINGVF